MTTHTRAVLSILSRRYRLPAFDKELKLNRPAIQSRFFMLASAKNEILTFRYRLTLAGDTFDFFFISPKTASLYAEPIN